MSKSQAQIVPTPRGKFMSVPENIKQHQQLLENGAFQRALEVSMAEYVRAAVWITTNPGPKRDPNNLVTEAEKAAAFSAIAGAQGFVEVLTRLAEPFQQMPTKQEVITSLE